MLGRARGFAFVTFQDDDAALKAIEALNGAEIADRAIRVSEAISRDRSADNRGNGGRGGYGGNRGGNRGGFGGNRGDEEGRRGGNDNGF